MIEDVDVLQTHALQALIEARRSHAASGFDLGITHSI